MGDVIQLPPEVDCFGGCPFTTADQLLRSLPSGQPVSSEPLRLLLKLAAAGIDVGDRIVFCWSDRATFDTLPLAAQRALVRDVDQHRGPRGRGSCAGAADRDPERVTGAGAVEMIQFIGSNVPRLSFARGNGDPVERDS